MVEEAEVPTIGKQLVNVITCGCESSASFFVNLQSRVRTHAVLVIGLYELLGNLTTRALLLTERHDYEKKVRMITNSTNLSISTKRTVTSRLN